MQLTNIDYNSKIYIEERKAKDKPSQTILHLEINIMQNSFAAYNKQES
jgi:hypothetical protein